MKKQNEMNNASINAKIEHYSNEFEIFITTWSFLKGLIASILFFFIFEEKIIKILQETFVDKVLKNIKPIDPFNYVFWAIICYIVVYYCFKIKNHFIVSRKFIQILVWVEFFYIYLGIWSKTWIFTPISEGSFINWMSILHAILIMNCYVLGTEKLRTFIREFWPKKEKNTLNSDEPIDNLDDDRLFLKEFILKTHDEIVNSVSKKTLAFGIVGNWGSGKTSFLNLLKNEFKKNKDLIIIDFNPWLQIGSKSIVDSFFSAINSKISYYSSSTTKLLVSYKAEILSIDDGSFIKNI